MARLVKMTEITGVKGISIIAGKDLIAYCSFRSSSIPIGISVSLIADTGVGGGGGADR